MDTQEEHEKYIELLNHFKGTPSPSFLKNTQEKRNINQDKDLDFLSSMRRLGVPDEVTNVLSMYSYLINDEKITHSYVERLGSHFVRKNIVTAEEALKFVRDDQKKRLEQQSPEQPKSVEPTSSSDVNVNMRHEKLLSKLESLGITALEILEEEMKSGDSERRIRAARDLLGILSNFKRPFDNE